MSTTVLARKYRPRNFEALVGQTHVVQALANALTQQRLHHAYLFTGTRGVGKTTVSRILAKSLNCKGADGTGDITAHPCGVCDACRDIDAGRFVDYVELDAASNRGVDEITQLLGQAVYKPVLGRFKVYMIDEVHMLSTTAFNAMLKTLEEPPDYLKFVLATTDPQKVPATVLSRCLQFNLRPMAPPIIVEHLAGVLSAEAIAAETEGLRLIARAARGSMRDALSLADQAIAYGGGRVEADAVRRMLGAVDRGHAVRLIEGVAARDAAALVAGVDGLRELGLSAAGALEEMLDVLQAVAVRQALGDAADDAADPDAATALRLASVLQADETQLLYSIVLHGRAELSLAPDEYSGLVMVLLRMLAFPPQAGAGEAMHRTIAPAAIASTPPSATARTASAATAEVAPAVTSVVLDDKPKPEGVATNASAPIGEDGLPGDEHPADARISDRWNDLVQRMIGVGSIGAMVRELAMQAACVGIVEAQARAESGQRWQLRVERENLRAPALRERLQQAMAEALQRPVHLDIEAGKAIDTPAERAAAERRRLQAEAEQAIGDDPLVRSLLAQYKTARIVPGSVKPI